MTAVLPTVPAVTAAPVRPARPRSWAGAAIVAVVAAIAFAFRLQLLLHSAGLTGPDGYDDGVYFAAADALVHGRLPYRDFLLLHPPGIAVALAPFAAIGSVLGDPLGVALGRLAFIGVGAANSALVAVLAGRTSRSAALVGGMTAAVFFPLVMAERSTLLEPLGTLLLLLAVLVARSGGGLGAIAGGVLAGLSIEVKIWYVVPVVVLLVLQPGHRVRFAGGAVAGAAVLGLPFLLADPVAMVREVVLDQLGRPSSALHGSVRRLLAIVGSPLHGHPGAEAVFQTERFAVVVLVVLAAAAVAAWRERAGRIAVVQSVATTAVLLSTPTFFLHYAAFAAPWFALVLGVGTGAVLRGLPRPVPRAAAAAALAVLIVLANLHLDGRRLAAPVPVAALGPAARAVHGCVQSDDPGALAAMGVLSSDLQRGCALWPDVTGWTYDRDALVRDGRAVPRAENARWQHDVLLHLRSGTALVVTRSSTGLSSGSRHALAALPVLGRAGGLVLHASHRQQQPPRRP